MAQLWEDGEFEKFSALRVLSRHFRDLKVYMYRGQPRYASKTITSGKESSLEFEVERDYPVPEVAPVALIVSAMTNKGRVFADPPCVHVAIRNPNGFGFVPEPGWEQHLQSLGFAPHVIAGVQDWLDKNPPIPLTAEQK